MPSPLALRLARLYGPDGTRSGKWKLLLSGRKPEQPHRYLMDFGTNNCELYDLESDPAERWDLAYLYPETVSELKAEFDQFKATIKQR